MCFQLDQMLFSVFKRIEPCLWEKKQNKNKPKHIPCSFIYQSPTFHRVNLVEKQAFFVYPLFSSNIYWYSVSEVINAPQGPIVTDSAAEKHIHSSQAATSNDDHTTTASRLYSLLITITICWFTRIHFFCQWSNYWNFVAVLLTNMIWCKML